MSQRDLAVGDPVTVRTTDRDPIEISLHHHAFVTEVRPAQESAPGTTYMVGHPGLSERRYGPYGADRLERGWDTP